MDYLVQHPISTAGLPLLLLVFIAPLVALVLVAYARVAGVALAFAGCATRLDAALPDAVDAGEVVDLDRGVDMARSPDLADACFPIVPSPPDGAQSYFCP